MGRMVSGIFAYDGDTKNNPLVKPANIFAASRGSLYDVAKLLDFGLEHSRASPHHLLLQRFVLCRWQHLQIARQQQTVLQVTGRT